MKVAQYQLDEILNQINISETVTDSLTKLVNTNKYARRYLESSISDEWCEFDPDEVKWKISDYHRSMAGQILLNASAMRIFDILFSNKVTMHTKHHHYKSLMEMLYKDEALILQAVLKKNLTSLYPNITIEAINSVL